MFCIEYVGLMKNDEHHHYWICCNHHHCHCCIFGLKQVCDCIHSKGAQNTTIGFNRILNFSILQSKYQCYCGSHFFRKSVNRPHFALPKVEHCSWPKDFSSTIKINSLLRIMFTFQNRIFITDFMLSYRKL